MPLAALRSTFDRLGSVPVLVNPLPEGPTYGLLAEFATPADLYRACEAVRPSRDTPSRCPTP